MFENMNSGYTGYSMSNRAVEAYENGEKPFSKWTKKEIIEKLTNEYSNVNFNLSVLKQAPAKVVKNLILVKTSWHHTSNRCNRTDFYSIDELQLSSLTNEKIIDAINNFEKEKANQKQLKYKGKIEYLEWSGTRKHPKATKKILEDIYIEEKGCFYIITDEENKEILRKKIGSNGTYVTKYQ